MTAQELELGIAALTRGYARSFETGEQIGRAALQLALYDLPDDYFEQFVPRVERVTTEDVSRVMTRHLDPGRLTTLIVGDLGRCRRPSWPGWAWANRSSSPPTPSDRNQELIRSVKAVRFHEHGGPEVLRYEDAPDPVPAAGEVLVRVRACALNHLDLWERRGLPNVPIPMPHISGSDVAGEVVASTAPDVAPGRRVMLQPGISCGRCAACLSGRDNECPRYEVLGYVTSPGRLRRVRHGSGAEPGVDSRRYRLRRRRPRFR